MSNNYIIKFNEQTKSLLDNIELIKEIEELKGINKLLLEKILEKNKSSNIVIQTEKEKKIQEKIDNFSNLDDDPGETTINCSISVKYTNKKLNTHSILYLYDDGDTFNNLENIDIFNDFLNKYNKDDKDKDNKYSDYDIVISSSFDLLYNEQEEDRKKYYSMNTMSYLTKITKNNNVDLFIIPESFNYWKCGLELEWCFGVYLKSTLLIKHPYISHLIDEFKPLRFIIPDTDIDGVGQEDIVMNDKYNHLLFFRPKYDYSRKNNNVNYLFDIPEQKILCDFINLSEQNKK